MTEPWVNPDKINTANVDKTTMMVSVAQVQAQQAGYERRIANQVDRLNDMVKRLAVADQARGQLQRAYPSRLTTSGTCARSLGDRGR